MSCKYCKHCQDIKKEKDYKERKSYVESCRINLYIPQTYRDGMTIDEAEQYLAKMHGADNWYRLSFDIPAAKEMFNKWNKKGE